uniref:Si:ch211-76l23.4 n=1 Tax=Maylandia zebra TaxID=106582 RepID=A0A3P9B092_9CICH
MLVCRRGVFYACVLSFWYFLHFLHACHSLLLGRVKRSAAEELQNNRYILTLAGASAIMASKLSVLLLVLTGSTLTVLAQRRRPASKATDEWNFKEGSDRVNMRNVANLTEVLDNWRFDIINQMKGLLQNDHQSLLPDYARIQPLSEALDDLFKEFNALKTRLGDLTDKFTAIETFIDEVKTSRATSSNANTNPNPNTSASTNPNTGTAVAPVVRQRRVMRKKAPASS